MKKRRVIFAPTPSQAKKSAGARRDALLAWPEEPRNLWQALREDLPVQFTARRTDRRFWNLVNTTYLLPAAPSLLRHAIDGIGRHPAHHGTEAVSERGPASAFWIEGKLTPARTRQLLADPAAPRLWVIEDFRALRLPGPLLPALARRGIRLAVFRKLRARRVYRSLPR